MITVLLVDDHTMLAEGVALHLLSDDAIAVVGMCGTVADAVAAVQALRPDVVVLDHHLPDGDSHSATAEILSLEPATRVILMTSAKDHDVLAGALQAGCSGVIMKDESTDVIPQAIRSVAAGAAWIPQEVLSHLATRMGAGPVGQGVGGDLTDRETAILRLLDEGRSTGDMASILFLSTNTVRNYVQSLLSKLGVHSRLEAVSLARREGLLR